MKRSRLRARRATPRRKVHPIQPGAVAVADTVELSDTEWRAEVERRAHGRCQLALHPRCPGRGNHAHHRLLRRHPEANTPENGRWLCAFDHDVVHRNVSWARRHLWLLSPGMPFPPPVVCPLTCEEDHR